MKQEKSGKTSISHDAAMAAATVILEEFAPHCPNGMAQAMHERLCEIIEAAMRAADADRWRRRSEPSTN